MITQVVELRSNATLVRAPAKIALRDGGNSNAVWVIADVFERDLDGIKVGAWVDIELVARIEPLKGHVMSIGSTLTGSPPTAPVYIALDEQVADVRAGMLARAAIKGPTGETIFLPSEAVLMKASRFLVYVKVGDNTFAVRPVKVGHSVGDQIAILSGLKVGDVVAVKGALLLDGVSEQMR